MNAHKYESKSVNHLGLVNWTSVEDQTWATLIARQAEVIPRCASKLFFEGLEKLSFPTDRVPQIPEINKILKAHTGFSLTPVPALIQAEEFFLLLANKQFPMATFIRLPQDLDYIQEPDVFHEVYGHAPMLTNVLFCNFIEEFAKLALSLDSKYRRKLFRLFWFTIEFGLIREEGKVLAFGAGILSSIEETSYALSSKPKYLDHNFLDILRTPYRIDIMQPVYFVLDKVEDLFSIFDFNIIKIMEEALTLGDFLPQFESRRKVIGHDVGLLGVS